MNESPEIAAAKITITAESRTRRLIDRYAVTIRWITALAAAVFCLLSPRVSGWQVPICLLVLAWAVFRLIRRRHPDHHGAAGTGRHRGLCVGLTQPLTSTADRRAHPDRFRDQHLQSRQPDLRLAATAGDRRAALLAGDRQLSDRRVAGRGRRSARGRCPPSTCSRSRRQSPAPCSSWSSRRPERRTERPRPGGRPPSRWRSPPRAARPSASTGPSCTTPLPRRC